MLNYNPQNSITIAGAKQKFLKLLSNSVSKYIKSKNIGILFSGGLDSSVIAKIASETESNVMLYCAGFSNMRDIDNAKNAAVSLNLPLQIIELDPASVESSLPNILSILINPTPMDLGIAIPLYFATEQAQKTGKSIILCGQGADESLGGYYKYIDILKTNGYKTLHYCLQNDVLGLFESLKRELAISSYFHIELGFPFLDRDLLQFVLQLPTEYKIYQDDSKFIRKYLLRLIAEDLELSPQIYKRPKLAAQYGAGSHKFLNKLAKKKGFTKAIANKYGYRNNLQMLIDFICYSEDLFIPETRKTNLNHYLSDHQ